MAAMTAPPPLAPLRPTTPTTPKRQIMTRSRRGTHSSVSTYASATSGDYMMANSPHESTASAAAPLLGPIPSEPNTPTSPHSPSSPVSLMLPPSPTSPVSLASLGTPTRKQSLGLSSWLASFQPPRRRKTLSEYHEVPAIVVSGDRAGGGAELLELVKAPSFSKTSAEAAIAPAAPSRKGSNATATTTHSSEIHPAPQPPTRARLKHLLPPSLSLTHPPHHHSSNSHHHNPPSHKNSLPVTAHGEEPHSPPSDASPPPSPRRHLYALGRGHPKQKARFSLTLGDMVRRPAPGTAAQQRSESLGTSTSMESASTSTAAPTIGPTLPAPPVVSPAPASAHDVVVNKLLERPAPPQRSASLPAPPQPGIASVLHLQEPHRRASDTTEEHDDERPVENLLDGPLEPSGGRVTRALVAQIEAVLTAQEEIARAHLALEHVGTGAGADVGGDGGDSSGFGSGNAEMDLAKRFQGVDEIMHKLSELSVALKSYHAHGTPMISFPQRGVGPASLSPKSPRGPQVLIANPEVARDRNAKADSVSEPAFLASPRSLSAQNSAGGVGASPTPPTFVASPIAMSPHSPATAQQLQNTSQPMLAPAPSGLAPVSMAHSSSAPVSPRPALWLQRAGVLGVGDSPEHDSPAEMLTPLRPWGDHR